MSVAFFIRVQRELAIRRAVRAIAHSFAAYRAVFLMARKVLPASAAANFGAEGIGDFFEHAALGLDQLRVEFFECFYSFKCFHRLFVPNKSPEPTAVGACRSAVAVHAASRRWLSFFR